MDGRCVSSPFPKALSVYRKTSKVVSWPKGDYISPLRPIKGCFLWQKREEKLHYLLVGVNSAASQLGTIHTEFTACAAFYRVFIFLILCPLHNNQENGNVIKMLLQLQMNKIQSQQGRQ